jgi:lysozyme
MLAGPDVSENNGAVAWSRVAVPGHQLAFAFAKASEGDAWIDPGFAANWQGIREHGLIRGAYHFARPAVSGAATVQAVRAAATAEAEHMLAVLHEAGDVGEGDLPPVLDLETSRGLSAAQLYDWVGTWVDVVAASVGRKPIIYTGELWKSMLNAYTDVWGCPLWLSQYGPKPQLPRAWKRWTFWQFTDAASVDGVTGDVDLSYFSGTQHELEELAGVSPRARSAAASAAGPSAPPWPGRVLERGVRGADVREWQEQMRRRGFVRIPTDGTFDEQSAEMCRWLQLYLRYPPSDRVDETTWHAKWVSA